MSELARLLRDTVRSFAEEKIAPFAEEWDHKSYFPYKEAVKPMGELGFFGTVIPEEYGGNEMGWLAAIIITEEIARLMALGEQAAINIENSKMFEKIRERDRLAVLGEMAAGMAHEIRNPLGAIKGLAQFLGEKQAGDATQAEMTHTIAGEAIQSAMRVDDPDALALDYTRCMMAFLLFVPSPDHVLMVGLGGGSLAKFCHRHLPRTRLTVVEVNADVIALRGEFEVPDDERLAIIQADAAEYLPAAEGDADVLLLDGFDDKGIAPTFLDRGFYRAARNRLRPGGLLVANFAGQPNYLKEIATVSDSVEEPRSLSRLNGENAVTLVVRKQSGSNTVKLIDAVKQRHALAKCAGQPGNNLIGHRILGRPNKMNHLYKALNGRLVQRRWNLWCLVFRHGNFSFIANC